jgi:hypothetical protein
MSRLPNQLSKAKILLHMLIEKDAQDMGFGTSSFTLQIDEQGEPVVHTLKVTSAARIKYGK